MRRLVGEEAAEDLVAQASAEGPVRLGRRVARPEPALQVGSAGTTEPDLGDGDPVEGAVELAVAAPAQPMADLVPRPDRDRGRPGVAGEGRPRPEATDARRLADDLGSGERSAADELQERRSQGPDPPLDLHLEGPDRGASPIRARISRARRAASPRCARPRRHVSSSAFQRTGSAKPPGRRSCAARRARIASGPRSRARSRGGSIPSKP